MSITQKPFGTTAAGQAVTEYTMTNGSGAAVSILDFGGIVTRILVPDKAGKLGDVNLSFDDINIYAQGKSGSMGALIGRVGNRIGGAAFDLEGKHYVLGKNDGGNNLHGGPEGFNFRMWTVEPKSEPGTDTLTMTLHSPDGDQGFPGNVEVKVDYSFNDAGELGIRYHAATDRPTLVNLTNHCYFNLDGHDAGTIEDLSLQINAEAVTEIDGGLIPTGKLLPVGGLVYGFDKETRIGDVLSHVEDEPAMKAVKGVDFNYCAGRDRETKLIAVLRSPKTGRKMEVITDQPGVQCYTAQYMDETGKGGVHYGPYCGICLETQHYPDAIHQPQFHSVVLRPQDSYDTFSVYRFSVE